MNEWRPTKLGHALDEGLLHIYLYADSEGWKITVYLREGVQIGELKGGDQILVGHPLSVPPGYPAHRVQEPALEQAESWLLDHANELLLAKAELWIPGVRRPVVE